MRKILLGIILLALLASPGYCQEAQRPLTLTIKSDKQVYYVQDRYKMLILTLENMGKDKITPYDIFYDSFLVIDGKEIPYGNRVVWWGKNEGNRPISPGVKFSRRENIGNLFNANEPGKYSIFWKYKGITSNTIVIKVEWAPIKRKAIDKIGLLKHFKGVNFCPDAEQCVFVEDLGIESKYSYKDLWPLADKNTKVHIIGTIVTLPANRHPDCEKSQVGCREVDSLVIEQLEILE